MFITSTGLYFDYRILTKVKTKFKYLSIANKDKNPWNTTVNLQDF